MDPECDNGKVSLSPAFSKNQPSTPLNRLNQTENNLSFADGLPTHA